MPVQCLLTYHQPWILLGFVCKLQRLKICPGMKCSWKCRRRMKPSSLPVKPCVSFRFHTLERTTSPANTTVVMQAYRWREGGQRKERLAQVANVTVPPSLPPASPPLPLFWMTAPTQLHGKRPPLSCCENYEQVVIARMIHCFAPGGESSLRGPPPHSASSECESWLKTCERLGLSLSTTCDLARLPKKSRCSLGD